MQYLMDYINRLLSSSTTNNLSLESAIINSQKTMEIAEPDKTTSVEREMKLFAESGTTTNTLKKFMIP